MTTSTPGAVDHHRALAGQTRYLYGLVPAGARPPQDLAGLHRATVRIVELEHVSALVSDITSTEVIGLPAEVRAHAAVLDAVVRDGPVLPVRFGTLTGAADALYSALPTSRQEVMAGRLAELADLVQLSLTARYEQDAVLAELVAEDLDIRRLRSITRGQPEVATYGARVRLGELVVAGFERKRAVDAARLERSLARLVDDIRHRETGQVDDLLDVAVLVRRDAVGAFEEELEGVAAELAERARLRLVGPQAPYDFAEEV